MTERKSGKFFLHHEFFPHTHTHTYCTIFFFLSLIVRKFNALFQKSLTTFIKCHPKKVSFNIEWRSTAEFLIHPKKTIPHTLEMKEEKKNSHSRSGIDFCKEKKKFLPAFADLSDTKPVICGYFIWDQLIASEWI